MWKLDYSTAHRENIIMFLRGYFSPECGFCLLSDNSIGIKTVLNLETDHRKLGFSTEDPLGFFTKA